MTVLVDDTVERYTIAGVGPYPFSFRIFDATDLQVTACSSATPPVPTLLTHLSDYTVDGENDADGGTVTLVAGTATTYAGYTLDIRSNTPETQPTSIRNQGRFLPEIHEDAFDHLCRQIQDLRRTVRACIRYPDNVLDDGTMTPLSSWLSRYLTINSSGVLEAAALSSTAITASIITSLLSGSTAEQDAILALLLERTDTAPALVSLKRTAAEIAASVTPVNYSYAPLNILRYATGDIGDGVLDAAPAINAAVAVAKQSGGVVIIPEPSVCYRLLSPIDCTYAASANRPGFTIRGEGGTSLDAPGFLAPEHTGHVFDLAGNPYLVMDNITVRSLHATTNPKTGLFRARNSNGDSQIFRFINCKFIGKFTEAADYNYGSEDDVFIGCYFHNTDNGANAKTIVITANNIRGLSSTFITIATGPQSCIDHQYIGGQFVHSGSHANADVFYLDQVNGLKVWGPWMSCVGRSLFNVDTTNAASSLNTLMGVQGENGSLPDYGIRFGDASATCTGWTIHGCYLPNNTAAIASHAAVTLDNFDILNLSEQAAHGISVPGVLQASSIIGGSLVLAIGTSRRNHLVGQLALWSITTRDNDFWIDIGSGSKTWTPNTSAMTITGALTMTFAKIIHHGPLVTLLAQFQAATSMVCAAGTILGGVPTLGAGGGNVCSAIVLVTNNATNLPIGAGHFDGTNIRLPAINVGGNVPITVTCLFFAA